MAALSKSQKHYLIALSKTSAGVGNVPGVHVPYLVDQGFVKKTDQGSGQRGMSRVSITDAGRKAAAA